MSEDTADGDLDPKPAMTAEEAVAACRAEIARVRAEHTMRRRPDPPRQRSARQRPVADEVSFLRDEMSLLIRQMAALAEHARHLQERLDVLLDPTRVHGTSDSGGIPASDLPAEPTSADSDVRTGQAGST